MVHSFKFTGYRSYPSEAIQKILQESLADEDLNYFIAISEAVCNATKYAVDGLLEAEIEITLKVESCAVQTTIKSKSKPFDAASYREKLRSYAKNKEIKKKDWQDVWMDEENLSGRGFWLMLAACDYIFVDSDGECITLHTPRPNVLYRTQIEQIVPRFFILSKGVIK